MESLTALGLAAAVVQFVEFASDIVLNTNKIFHSVRGMSDENVRLEQVYESLQGLSARLQGNLGETTPTGASLATTFDETTALRNLSASCKSDCDALLKVISQSIVKDGPNRRWRSAKAALRSTLSKDTIETIQAGIARSQSVMSLQMVSILSRQVTQLEEAVRSLKWNGNAASVNQQTKLDEITDSLRTMKMTDANQMSSMDMDDLLQRISAALTGQEDLAREQAILKSLQFRCRPIRHETIADAHSNTFQWVYRPDFKFRQWLRQKNGIFWVAGKAGSGKSTLMKFVADNQQTQDMINEWASPKKAIIVSHYFWSLGTEMQKSQQGLLQGIVYEIFRKCPSIIREVCPGRWNAAGHGQLQSWTVPELSACLREISNQSESAFRFCLFVDGLDEFAGDHIDLCQAFKDMGESKHIKLCLSSRPLNVFVDCFGRDPDTSLLVHELTYNDIQSFAESRLLGHPRWGEYSISKEELSELVGDIASRAEGVFLWAFLVTKSLREGLSNDDTLADLKARLESLPTDLGGLFKQMLNSVDTIYHGRMATTLKVALHAAWPLRLDLYYHLDQAFGIDDYPLSVPARPLTEDERYTASEQTRRRINARCSGLLEVRAPFATLPWVEFLHRTVRDFLCTREMDEFLLSKINNPRFSPYCMICRIFVGWIKSTVFIGGAEVPSGERLPDLVGRIFEYASEVPETDLKEVEAIIDDLENAVVKMSRPGMPVLSWGSPDQRRAFRELVLCSNSQGYLSRKLSHDDGYLTIFDDAAISVAMRTAHRGLKTIPGTIRVLLEHGQDPNEPLRQAAWLTPWKELLRAQFDIEKRIELHVIIDGIHTGLFSLFLRHGADPNANLLPRQDFHLPAFAVFLFSLFSSTPGPGRAHLHILEDFLNAGADLDMVIKRGMPMWWGTGWPLKTETGSVKEVFCGLLVLESQTWGATAVPKSGERAMGRKEIFNLVTNEIISAAASKGQNVNDLAMLARRIFPLQRGSSPLRPSHHSSQRLKRQSDGCGDGSESKRWRQES